MENENTPAESVEEPALLLQNLPTDILLSVFYYCDYRDLMRLTLLCKRFQSILNDESFWRTTSLKTLVTNLRDDEMKKRCRSNVSPREKVRLSYNWQTARFKEHVTMYFGTRYMPWLCLGNDHLWLSKGNVVLAFKRIRKGNHLYIDKRPSLTLRGHSKDICRVVHQDGIVISCSRGTSIYGFPDDGRTEKPLFHNAVHHYFDLTAADMKGKTIVSGFDDGHIKIYQINEASNSNELELTVKKNFQMKDSVRSAAIRPNFQECFFGTSGWNKSESPLRLYNMERGVEMLHFNMIMRHGAGVLDANWESPHTLLTTGYDTYIRLWDCRTGNCELSWVDPFDSSIYCLASDNLYTILAGTCNHGRVQLWDKRQATSVQMFYLSSKYSRQSSIYSLSFDPCNMYAALDATLNVADFAGNANKPKKLWINLRKHFE